MNFLAHFYLSFNDPDIITGNFLGDCLTKKEYELLPTQIFKGVKLHHFIDEYTDAHPIFQESKKVFLPRYRHYASVLVDIFYDYLLTKEWENYSEVPLDEFGKKVYAVLDERKRFFSKKALKVYSSMVKYDWLDHYRNPQGIMRVLEGMDRRSTYKSGMSQAWEEFEMNEQLLESQFKLFFAEMITETRKIIS